MLIDVPHALCTDKGHVRTADYIAGELHVGLTGDEAELVALNKRTEPGIQFIPESVVEQACGRRHYELPLA
jgi:hypothetical protein